MFSVKDLLSALEKMAPLELSKACIEQGDYDNSGIIINSGREIKKVLFSLDLSERAVEVAVKNGCDAIVTHHPAIYNPIKNISIDDKITSSLLLAMKNNLSVISMHLNLDIAPRGIDYQLALALGGNKQKILTITLGLDGYGREFVVKKTPLKDFVKGVKETFKTDRVVCYGDKEVNVIASFCGGGSNHAVDMIRAGLTDCDTVVTSDMSHHVIKELVENGKNIILLPHYTAEEYGFNKFYLEIDKTLKGKVDCFYFADERFI